MPSRTRVFVISAPTRSVRYRAATSADVPAMVRCRAADAGAGPADGRMARYLDGQHHPQGALAPRTGFVALIGDDVVAYIAGHETTRQLAPQGSESPVRVRGQRPESESGVEVEGPGSDSDPDAVEATKYDCEGEVQYLYVAPRARRRGVAAHLLRLLAGWFDERGIRRACVNADVESEGATAFYLAARARPLNRHWYVWDDFRIVSSADPSGEWSDAGDHS